MTDLHGGTFLYDFRNKILTVSGMQGDENVYRLIESLKFNIRVKALNARVETLDEWARVAFNVNGAIWRAGMNGYYPSNYGTTSMEV